MLSIQCPEVEAMKQIFRDIEDFLRLFAVVPPLPLSSSLPQKGSKEKQMRQQIKRGSFLPPLFLANPPLISLSIPLLTALFELLCRSSLFFSPPFVSDVPSEQSVFVMLNGEESELRFLNISNPKVSRFLLNPFFFFIF